MSQQLLEWDTSFFGFPVARICDSHLTAHQLAETLNQLAEQRISLVYWSSNSKLDDEVARSLSGILVDRKITYVTDLRQFDPATQPGIGLVAPFTSEGCSIEDLRKLELLAIQSAEFSRFAKDPRISKARVDALYTLWMKRSIYKQIASEVLVAHNSNHIVAVVTLGEKEGRGDIGLLAVDSEVRGRKFGECLVRAAQSWFVSQGYEIGQVVTQLENRPACRLYEKCGYSIEKLQYFYHFWPAGES